MNTKITLFRTAALIMLLFLFPGMKQAFAQTTLVAGDLAFTGYNSNDGSGGATMNQVSFIILRSGGVSSSTVIHITDNGYNSTSGVNALTTNEGDITITLNAAMPQFTEIFVSAGTAGTGPVTVTQNSSGTFSSSNISASLSGTFQLSTGGDQVFAFQGSLASPTFITGLHMNSEIVGGASQPATTAASWDAIAAANGPSGWIMSGSRSGIPPTLTNGVNALIGVVSPGSSSIAEKDNGKYDCAQATASSLSALRTKLMDVNNWILQEPAPVTVPSACSYSLGVAAVITGQPSNSTACSGSGTTFTATASNPTGWTWEISTNGGANYSTLTISGVYSVNSTTGTTGSSTLTISDATGLSGNMYRAIATGSSGNATSNGATLTVTPGVSVTAHPANTAVCPSSNTTFSVTASNVASYQWQVSTNSGGSYTNISNTAPYSGTTTSTLTITGATAGLNGNYYRVVLNGNSPCSAVNSNAGILTITGAPSISVQPSGVTLCEGNTSFSVTASNATGYQWRVNPGSGYVNVTNTGVYTGATTSTLTLTGATGTMNGYLYQVIVSNGCTTTTTSSAATLTITPDTWTGTTSSAWNTATNWGCGVVPASTTNVVIPSGTPNSPLINITTATCNNLTINSGATLDFSGTTNILDVKGTITNNGTFNASFGKVKLSGSGAQSLPGLAYKDLELNGSGTKTLTGAATLSGVLTLTAGFLQLGNFDLTLGNSASIAGTNAVLLNTSPTSYIITNVATSASGQLKIQNIGTGGKTGAVLFPIGTSTSSYTPVTIQNAGTADVFGARVRNGVYKSYNAAGDNNGPVQNTYNVGKTWMLSEATAGGSNATVNFAWSSIDEQPGFNDGACFASHFENGGWRTVLPAQTANGFDPYSLAMNNITSFSPFAIGSQFSILPLDLLSFTGKATKNGNALNWVTANEKNVAGFDIERSATGSDYQRIGNVPARANNSTTETSYDYTDAAANTGTAYYRLKMTDLDGTFKYSNTVVINTTDRNGYSFTVYPNPVDGNDLHIQLSAATTTGVDVKITDMTGRVWYQATAEAGKAVIPVNVKSLPAGIYQLHISGDAINGTTRFTKL